VSDAAGEKLKELLRKQLQSARDEALRHNGEVPPDRAQALAHLATLVDLYQKYQPGKRRQWSTLIALASTLLIVSLLLFVRVRETEIELDLALSEVSFNLSGDQALTTPINLSAVGVSGLREIRLPQNGSAEARTVEGSDGDAAVRLATIDDANRKGSVDLATLLIAAKTRIRLLHTGAPYQYRLSLAGSELKFRVDINGPVEVAVAGTGVEQLDLAAPAAVFLQSTAADQVNLDLTFPTAQAGGFSSQLAATDLNLFQVDEFQMTRGTIVRQTSTIRSGSLYFVSLNDKEHKLRAGEMLRFDQVQGEFREIKLAGDQLEVKFHGRVRGLSVGSPENRRSIMPTWLEWLVARHSVSLVWGTALYLFTLVVAVARWWGKSL
jgi:hypothetical protein